MNNFHSALNEPPERTSVDRIFFFFFGMTATNNSISHHKRYFIIRATFIAAILCVFFLCFIHYNAGMSLNQGMEHNASSKLLSFLYTNTSCGLEGYSTFQLHTVKNDT